MEEICSSLIKILSEPEICLNFLEETLLNFTLIVRATEEICSSLIKILSEPDVAIN